jgi:hypothetical protein
MIKYGSLAKHAGKIMVSVMLALLVIFNGCSSSSHHVTKGKPGQVPCPCEKKSNRR